jgi:hypothetical protein
VFHTAIWRCSWQLASFAQILLLSCLFFSLMDKSVLPGLHGKILLWLGNEEGVGICIKKIVLVRVTQNVHLCLS